MPGLGGRAARGPLARGQGSRAGRVSARDLVGGSVSWCSCSSGCTRCSRRSACSSGGGRRPCSRPPSFGCSSPRWLVCCARSRLSVCAGVSVCTGGALLAVVLWTLWPLWAGPAAGAWKTAHGGFGGAAGGGPRYPLGAILAASPVAMGMVAFLLLAVAMVLAPRVSKQKRERPAPPADPQPLRAPLVASRVPATEPPPQHPPRWP